MRLKFRPHHVLCNLGFQGKGYSDEFVSNFNKINTLTNDDNSVEIEIVEFTDDICAPCPHKRDSLCTKQGKIERLDQAHSKALGIKSGDVLTWSSAKNLIAQSITLEKFEEICAPCSWKELGICRKALEQLLEDRQRMGLEQMNKCDRQSHFN